MVSGCCSPGMLFIYPKQLKYSSVVVRGGPGGDVNIEDNVEKKEKTHHSAKYLDTYQRAQGTPSKMKGG